MSERRKVERELRRQQTAPPRRQRGCANPAACAVLRRDPDRRRSVPRVPRVSARRRQAVSRRTSGGDGGAAVAGRLPTVEAVDRLSRTPIFESCRLNNLFRVIESGQHVRYAARQEGGREGATESGRVPTISRSRQPVVKPRVAPRAARRPLDKARRGRILGIFDRGATQSGGMHRRSNAAGTLATGCQGCSASLLAPAVDRHDGFPAQRTAVSVCERRTEDTVGRQQILSRSGGFRTRTLRFDDSYNPTDASACSTTPRSMARASRAAGGVARYQSSR